MKQYITGFLTLAGIGVFGYLILIVGDSYHY